MKKIVLALTAFLFAVSSHAQVRQSGNVTPGHIATWTTTGVIQDGGAIPVSRIQVGNTTMYLNKDSGNDANSCLSLAAACKTSVRVMGLIASSLDIPAGVNVTIQ